MWCKEFTTTLRNDLACHLVVCRPLRLLQCIGCCDSGELNPATSDRTVVVDGGHMRSKVFLPSSDGTVATARRPKINTIAALALKISADAESKAPVYDKKWLIAANRHPESKTLMERALKALESDVSEGESIIECLMGWDPKTKSGTRGIFGKLLAWARTDEEQGRKTLHGHWQLWVEDFNLITCATSID